MHATAAAAQTLVKVHHPVDSTEAPNGAHHGPNRYTIWSPTEPFLRANDQGAVHGDGAFDTFPAWDGTVHNLAQRMKRFARSCLELGLGSIDESLWHDAVLAALGEHKSRGAVHACAVRITLTRGVPGESSPQGWVLVRAVPDFTTLRHQGVGLALLNRGISISTTQQWMLSSVKTLSYAVNTAAIREAQRRDLDEVLFVSDDGFILDGATSSVVFDCGSEIVCPSAGESLLAGSTTAIAQRYFADVEGLPVSNRRVAVDELHTVESAWMVSSVRQSVPVTRIEAQQLKIDRDRSTRLLDYLTARYQDPSA